MPYVIEGECGGYVTRHGHSDASIRNAWRFETEDTANRVANTVRRGVDRPCALHKGPAGDCKPWNCVCY